MDSIWKEVAIYWRVHTDNASSASIEDLTNEALKLIKTGGLLDNIVSLDEVGEDEDDGDWP